MKVPAHSNEILDDDVDMEYNQELADMLRFAGYVDYDPLDDGVLTDFNIQQEL